MTSADDPREWPPFEDWDSDSTLNPERHFREVERRLDAAVSQGLADVTAHGLTVEDWSGRSYYKNEELTWNFWFVNRRPRGIEIEKVSISIRVDEVDLTVARVGLRAEVSQPCKPSRWVNAEGCDLKVDELLAGGLAGRVISGLERGRAWLEGRSEVTPPSD